MPSPEAKLIFDGDAWQATAPQVVRRPAPATGVLLCAPDFFEIGAADNIHMEGQAGEVDVEMAHQEWRGLRSALSELGLRVCELTPQEGQQDLIFTCNPSLAGLDAKGKPFAMLSRMRHESRRDEVAVHEGWWREQGVLCHATPPGGCFEGGGDGLWHPDRYFLWGGVGARSDADIYAEWSRLLDLPVGILRLPNPAFYHLDTCLALLDEETAAYVPAGFDADGLDLLSRAFPRLIEVEADEARWKLAGNMYCPDRKNVLLPAHAPVTRERLEHAGFAVIDVPTDEFLKSGGSVYCLRQELYHDIASTG